MLASHYLKPTESSDCLTVGSWMVLTCCASYLHWDCLQRTKQAARRAPAAVTIAQQCESGRSAGEIWHTTTTYLPTDGWGRRAVDFDTCHPTLKKLIIFRYTHFANLFRIVTHASQNEARKFWRGSPVHGDLEWAGVYYRRPRFSPLTC